MASQSEVLLDVAVEDGKYRYVQTRNGSHVYRHGEPWQDVTGNKMIYCFAAEVAELREQLTTARAEAARHADDASRLRYPDMTGQ